MSEVLAGLSHALDITEGQPRGHAERCCLIGMRLARALEFDEHTRSSLFYALLLKDAGCSSSAAKVAALFGADDAVVKSSRRFIDSSSTPHALLHVLRQAGAGDSMLVRGQRVAAVLRSGQAHARSLVKLRCERGAEIVRAIGLEETTARALLDLDEHFNGGGYPEGRAGEDISLLGRVLCLVQTVEVFWARGGPAAACEVARRRRGTWFDPRLVDALISFEHDARFWNALPTADPARFEPSDHVRIADPGTLDRVVHAFASIVDAKSPYTSTHSEGVADLSVALADALGLEPSERDTLYRAALLHDIGKLGVSNRILDKPGALTHSDWQIVRRHPLWSMEILSRVRAFEAIARIAAAHHERLDGSGYHRGLWADQLDQPSRILAVADVAEALSAARPYRPALAPDEVLTAMARDTAGALDPEAVDALAGVLPAWSAGAR